MENKTVITNDADQEMTELHDQFNEFLHTKGIQGKIQAGI